MKKYLFPLTLLVLTLASCSDAMQDSFESEKLEFQFQTLDESNVVTYDNIATLNAAQKDTTCTSSDDLFTVDCITGDRGDTLIYS